MMCKTAVVCLGNELVGDDGVGIRVGRVLSGLPLPQHVTLLVRPNLGFELIELLEVFDRIVLVDAMRGGGSAGTCVVLDPEGAAAMANSASCSHSIGITEILELSRHLHGKLATVSIVGVEGQDMDTFGIGLSAPVQERFEEAVDMVLQELGADGFLRARGRERAAQVGSARVTLAEVLKPSAVERRSAVSVVEDEGEGLVLGEIARVEQLDESIISTYGAKGAGRHGSKRSAT
ncbi:MAG: hydrogenase maturation protease [Myxococcales bacterium]